MLKPYSEVGFQMPSRGFQMQVLSDIARAFRYCTTSVMSKEVNRLRKTNMKYSKYSLQSFNGSEV